MSGGSRGLDIPSLWITYCNSPCGDMVLGVNIYMMRACLYFYVLCACLYCHVLCACLYCLYPELCLILACDVCVWHLIYIWCLPVMLCGGLCNRACVVGLREEASCGVCEIIIENGDVCCDPHPSLRVFTEFALGRERSSLDNHSPACACVYRAGRSQTNA